MPLPLVIGGAVVVAAAAGVVSSGVSLKRIKGKSVLVVGPSGSGKTSLVSVLGDSDLEVRPSARRRWINRAVKLADLELRVTSIDTPGGSGGADAIRSGAERADLICLVVAAQALDSADGWESPGRIAKLVGEVAGSKTQCAIVVSNADVLSADELSATVASREVLGLVDLTGASTVLTVDLTDPRARRATAEALLGTLAAGKRPRKDRS